ncbi:MAG TPA: zinc ribbon domain-containing protein [Candidatus Dormibacteraeota bacterium]|nr:zinc ribbon domain-containing protein [Candidatus Dormibacteraeota bacterium]
MAFCNACGANIVPGTRFCNKCGAAILTSTLPPAAASPAPPASSTPPISTVAVPTPPPPSGGGALKAILIVVGVIVLVGILGLASLGIFAWRVARHTRVRQNGNDVKVETPFGTVQTTNDPQAAAHDLGVDLYPGAQVLKEGATSAIFGAVHTASLNFETSDSVDKVCGFYKPKFPNAMVMTTQADQCTIVSNDQKNMITITVKGETDKTRIVITNVTKSGAANSSSN